jgi:hypothetical protein
MRNRFTRVCYALAAVVAVTTTLGLSAVSAANASASMHTIRPNATPPCGPFCVNLYSQEFGPHMIQSVNPAVSKVGARIVLDQASNSNQGEDFVADVDGPVTVLCDNWPAPGSLSPNSYACLNYATPADVFEVLEADYQPYGAPTNLCVGVASKVPYSYERVTLQSCGSPRAMWIADTDNFTFYFNPPFPPSGPYVPWINAADTPSSHPQVLTVGYSHKAPHRPLEVQREKIFSSGTVYDSQQWGVFFGVAP